MAEKEMFDQYSHVEESDKRFADGPKLDPHGYLLNPQPSRFRDDPLVGDDAPDIPRCLC